MHRYINLADLARSDIDALIARAAELKAGARSSPAAGKTLGLLFLNPSLRTRVSMVGAWGLLGGVCADLTPGQGMWNLATGSGPMLGDEAEHMEEAAGVLGRLCDVLGVRAFASGSDWQVDRQDSLINAFARLARCPLVNMEGAMYHPCQALADWLTLEEVSRPGPAQRLQQPASETHFVLSWAWHPKPLPVAVPNSALLMACQRGMRVTLLRPEGWDLDPGVMEQARSLSAANGGSLAVSDERGVLKQAHVVYAKSWGSLQPDLYADKNAEKARREAWRDWCVGGPGAPVGDHTLAMHCLPVRRDVVMATSLLTGPNSLILDEAENRKWAQAAVLERMAR